MGYKYKIIVKTKRHLAQRCLCKSARNFFGLAAETSYQPVLYFSDSIVSNSR